MKSLTPWFSRKQSVAFTLILIITGSAYHFNAIDASMTTARVDKNQACLATCSSHGQLPAAKPTSEIGINEDDKEPSPPMVGSFLLSLSATLIAVGGFKVLFTRKQPLYILNLTLRF